MILWRNTDDGTTSSFKRDWRSKLESNNYVKEICARNRVKLFYTFNYLTKSATFDENKISFQPSSRLAKIKI